MIELVCNRVRFFSAHDEATFFSWAQSIPAVKTVSGRGQAIVLTLKRKPVSDKSLVELIALFHRYRIPMPQLAQFLSPRNQSWFADQSAFWFKPTFGGHPNYAVQPTRACGPRG